MDTKTVLQQIGNTPLVRLKQASELTGCHIYGKAEYFNPGESVKDRAALFIVQDAIKRKLISKGGTIVEGTAGNTGIGLAIVCKEYGLNLKIVIPKTQSIEKKETLRKLGAELIEVEAVPYSDPKNYIKQSKQIAEDLNKTNSYGVYWANQFDNTINSEAHIKTTAKPIPVFPAVPSTIVPPFDINFLFKASCTINNAARSFTDSPGLKYSALP